MHFITLTSDWNKNDFYTGALKGKILSSCQDVEIIELSNSVKTYNTAEAAFILRNSYHHFPEGTIHIVAVNTQPEPGCDLLAAKIDGHYFIAADNGIFGLLGDGEAEEIVILDVNKSDKSLSFPAIEVFAPSACRIISGEKLSDLGTQTENFKSQIPLRATLENNTITGTVIYIDSYGNVITNITREIFDRIGKERPFEIYVQSKHYKITKINQCYPETPSGDLIAIFNSIDLLEIAIRSGNAAGLLNLNTDSTIRVEFNAEGK